MNNTQLWRRRSSILTDVVHMDSDSEGLKQGTDVCGLLRVLH